ncbi:piggyBac transposable element-derived protein 4-like [Vespula maculifrons]|uniref:PiggyBac transposable element-derived protein 4-like n=1 Tax=Vespula maculifrons TaxID=7453 RepID=A0ABD2B0J9_VESMC
MIDQMTRKYTMKAGSRKWPILGINVWILYKETIGENISKKDFLFQLAEQLSADYKNLTKQFSVKAEEISSSTASQNQTHISIKHLRNPQTSHQNYRMSSTHLPINLPKTSNNTSISAAAHGCKLLLTAVVELRCGKLIRNNRSKTYPVLIDSTSQSYFITEKMAKQLNFPLHGLGKTQNSRKVSSFVTADVPAVTNSRADSRRVHGEPRGTTHSVMFRDTYFVGWEERIGLERRLQPRRRDVWLLRSMLTPIIFSRGTLFKDQTVKNVMLNRVHLPHSHFSSVARLDDASLVLSLYNRNKILGYQGATNEKVQSAKEIECESFKYNIYYDSERMLRHQFKNDRPYLGDSYTIAPKIFHVLERAFVRNPALKEQYLSFTNKYPDDENAICSKATNIIERNYYDDDLIMDTHIFDEAIRIRDRILDIASKHDFALRQWTSNEDNSLSSTSEWYNIP